MGQRFMRQPQRIKTPVDAQASKKAPCLFTLNLGHVDIIPVYMLVTRCDAELAHRIAWVMTL